MGDFKTVGNKKQVLPNGKRKLPIGARFKS